MLYGWLLTCKKVVKIRKVLLFFFWTLSILQMLLVKPGKPIIILLDSWSDWVEDLPMFYRHSSGNETNELIRKMKSKILLHLFEWSVMTITDTIGRWLQKGRLYMYCAHIRDDGIVLINLRQCDAGWAGNPIISGLLDIFCAIIYHKTTRILSELPQ